jgi:two-component system chemotaxis sensor kinase CheA
VTELSDIVKDFLVESYENLDQLDRDLVSLEQDPSSRATLGSIFRTIHTIKGTCGFLGFDKLESVTHVGENLLSRLREGELTINPDITSGLLSLIDAVRDMLANIETAGAEGEADYAALVKQLNLLQEAGGIPAPADSASIKIEPRQANKGPIAAAPEAPIVPVIAEPPTAGTASFSESLDCHPAGDSHAAAALGVAVQAKAPSDQPASSSKAQPEARTGGLADGSIRVDVGLLDKLMNQVGELVLARNQILQFTGTLNDPAFLSTSQRLNLITTELQEGVMKTRMQPIDNVWNKFPRVVRDLALQCGKQVRIEMEGKETELDKTIIEAIKDPLTHLVRNSVDHGIERPELRAAQGKAAEGCLLLRAFHEGGQVNIEITDDGAGLNLDRIKQKAVDRALITAELAARMSDREVGMLIFRPGFSTAEKVTNVSGRGVGMDVVKTNIEKIGGTVDLQSLLGRGTTVKIKIPLTLAIIPALLVTSGGQRYAIPQVSLLELVRLEREQARKSIEKMHDAPVYRLRGQLLPLVYLNRQLDPRSQPAESAGQADAVNIVVLQADGRQFGLVVDRINDTEEIVVKPLGKQLKEVPVFAGATIMGDGAVALILDVMGIAQHASVVSEIHDRGLGERTGKTQEQKSNVQTLLVIGLGENRRLALPISMVARLEEIDPAKVEVSDNHEVVQYRSQVLSLVRVADVLGIRSGAPAGKPLQVVVYSQNGRSAGLVVDRILDTVEASIEIQRSARTEGILGSVVIQQFVTDLIDPAAIIRRADPSFFEELAAV